MKNKLIKHISLGILVTISLTSCNADKKLKSITEEKAISLSKEIVARQKDASFKLPSWFTYKFNYSCDFNAKLYDTGISKTSTKIYEECLFNIDDLMMKEVYKRTESDSSHTVETYRYFDESKNQLVILSNQNGKKTKEVEDMLSKDYAILRFKKLRDDYYLTNDGNLDYFERDIAIIKVIQESIKDKKDQYINLYYGSNDEKSLQLLIDQKLETSETHPALTSTYELNGYQTYKSNVIYNLDLLDTIVLSYNTDIKCNNLGYYKKDVVKQEANYTYGKVKITLPNVDEYKEA